MKLTMALDVLVGIRYEINTVMDNGVIQLPSTRLLQPTQGDLGGGFRTVVPGDKSGLGGGAGALTATAR